VRGEVTIVVAGDVADAPAYDDARLEARIRALRDEGLGTRDVAERLATETGLSRRDLYARVLALDAGGPDDDGAS
jgi:16S rRNA C1402 (ribose-2'-O) methylase RsmI